MKKESFLALINLYRREEDFYDEYKELNTYIIDNDNFLSYLAVVGIILDELYGQHTDELCDYVSCILEDRSLSLEDAYQKLLSRT